MIDTGGTITVAEAAKRLHLSTEQVRRKLREGKLQGQHIGNQWFVIEASVAGSITKERLIPVEVMERVRKLNEDAERDNPGYVWDSVEMVRRSREEDLP